MSPSNEARQLHFSFSCIPRNDLDHKSCPISQARFQGRIRRILRRTGSTLFGDPEPALVPGRLSLVVLPRWVSFLQMCSLVIPNAFCSDEALWSTRGLFLAQLESQSPVVSSLSTTDLPHVSHGQAWPNSRPGHRQARPSQAKGNAVGFLFLVSSCSCSSFPVRELELGLELGSLALASSCVRYKYRRR